MKKILMLIAFLVSLPLMAQTNKSIVFIGDFTPELKDSVSLKFNSGIYNVFWDRLKHDRVQFPCTDELFSINDTISGCDWSNIPWSDSIAYVTLPDFPDCPLIVIYRVKICPNNPLIRQIDIISYSIELPYYTSCESLYNYIYSGVGYEQAIRIQEVYEQLYLLVSQHEAEQIADFPPCDSLGNYLPQYIFYNEVACKSAIIVNVEYYSVYYPPFIEQVTCIEAGCCKRAVSFCQDSLGIIHSNMITNEPVQAYCNGYPSEFDIENILNYYREKYYDAANISYEVLPCVNVCE